MMKRFKKDRLFHKELSIYDFSIPDFLEWFAEQDISKYVKIVRIEVPDQEDELLSSTITVMYEDETPCSGAEVSIAGINGITDEFGQCTIGDIPVLDEYFVSIKMDDYTDNKLYLTDEIKSIIFVIPNIEDNEQTIELEGPTETPASADFVQQGDEF